jgi:hypothetical protein
MHKRFPCCPKWSRGENDHSDDCPQAIAYGRVLREMTKQSQPDNWAGVELVRLREYAKECELALDETTQLANRLRHRAEAAEQRLSEAESLIEWLRSELDETRGGR